MVVDEKHRSGAWHTHIIFAARSDIRTGLDFDEVKRHRSNYKAQGRITSASDELRRIWKVLRRACASHEGWGRNGALPIRKNPEAFARYMSKYLTKQDGRGRRISYCGGWKRASSMKMAIVCGHARRYGRALAEWWNAKKGSYPGEEMVKKWLKFAAFNRGRQHNALGERCESFVDWLALGVVLDCGMSISDQSKLSGAIEMLAQYQYNYEDTLKHRGIGSEGWGVMLEHCVDMFRGGVGGLSPPCESVFSECIPAGDGSFRLESEVSA